MCVRVCAPDGKLRQPVSDPSDGAQRLVGRFLQPSQRIGCKPAPALSFLSWPFFAWPGCKPANRVRTKVRTFRVAAIPHRPALTGLSARCPTPPSANRKPCKPCFLVGRWRNAALAPPVLVFGQEGPVLPLAVDGVANRDLIHASEVSIPNAHPLFREETPGTRECVDFIGF